MDKRDRKRVGFLYESRRILSGSWVQRDLRILHNHFELVILVPQLYPALLGRKWKPLRVFNNMVGRLLDFIRLALEIKKTNLTFGWFADLSVVTGTLASCLLGKKSVVVVGGYDIENMPEINYGNMRHWWQRCLVTFCLKRATMVLPFSEYAAEKVKQLTNNKANIRVVNLACDTERLKPKGLKESVVITVGHIDKGYVLRKGFKTFVEAAKYLPEVKFSLIGEQRDSAIDELKAIATPNVEFPGFLSDDDLLSMYQRARVICLLSYQEGEGGGGVLGEAMACGCIPVVSEEAVALRETVGDCGFYVPYGDPEAAAEAVKKAMASPAELRQRVRERIEGLYSMGRREEGLLSAIHEVLNVRDV